MNKKEQIYYIKTNFPLYKTNGSKRMIRHDFFKNINTELQAYLLGFYVADGSIDEKRKTFRIHLSKKDKELVDLYKEIISPEARTFIVKQHFTTGREKSKIIAHEFSHILYTNHMDYFLRFDSKDTMWFNVNEMCACALEFFDDIYLSLLELNKQESDDDIAFLLKGEICNSILSKSLDKSYGKRKMYDY